VIHDSGHAFRQAAGRFASGVTVVTTRASQGHYGMTVSSFASLSLNPLLVTVSIKRSSPLLGYVRSAEAFAVSVLSGDQEHVAAYFATRGRTPEPAGFATVSSTARQTGAPIIDGCLSWFDCTVEDVLPGGDHEILVGRVAAAGGRTGEPLVSLSGGYRALTTEITQSDGLANASDGLAVAYHLLDVGPEEMLDAQSSVEPAMAALAAARTSAEDWNRLQELVDQSELVIDQPDEFNQLALAFHNAIAEASRNRVLQATLASLGQVQSIHYRDRGSPESAGAAVQGHRRLLTVLRTGDSEAAREEMRKHLDAVRGQLQIG
jgi:flavin reductase (DIM6/NTAB) family NADH-FMN oxidoreductase RutF/DNA-binding FadR family transcriptional regulator